ncbi:MAG: hypothetical protein IMF19_02670 [Proteobacteria bacterium]|nr:hypothetical protein [Pseudomonadota bacterium]
MAEIIRNVKNILISGLNLSFHDFGFIRLSHFIQERWDKKYKKAGHFKKNYCHAGLNQS